MQGREAEKVGKGVENQIMKDLPITSIETAFLYSPRILFVRIVNKCVGFPFTWSSFSAVLRAIGYC